MLVAAVAGRTILAVVLAALAACTTNNLPDAPKTVGATGKPHYKVGAPYKVDGKWYVPKVDATYDETGVASWYGDAFHGRLTANGEIFDKRRLSAAHKTLPLPTIVEVQNLENGKRVLVRVNDRGPFVDDRVIDLSHAAADELGFASKGLAKVRVRYLGEAELMELAALPGAKVPEPARVFANKTPATPVLPASTIAQDDQDSLGDLIAASIGQSPQASQTTAAVPSEIWVEVAAVDDLNALERMRLDLPDVGPLTVQADDRSGRIFQSLRVGPFVDEAIAFASLSRVQAAGFGEARIIRSAGG